MALFQVKRSHLKTFSNESMCVVLNMCNLPANTSLGFISRHQERTIWLVEFNYSVEIYLISDVVKFTTQSVRSPCSLPVSIKQIHRSEMRIFCHLHVFICLMSKSLNIFNTRIRYTMYVLHNININYTNLLNQFLTYIWEYHSQHIRIT